ncbi:E3 ubiquitin-protein ligase RNF19A-like isoform X4 [Tubulanus polymorphus]|uniref:E3 ubiquitin-protein ligase RNF19A-like isoform X4 n=2 Tax=Tubulanus polymorphus TaxID=672921 RepID=UPI003DA1CD2E
MFTAWYRYRCVAAVVAAYRRLTPGGVRFEFEENEGSGPSGPYAPDSHSIETTSHRVANPSIGPSIGEMSMAMTGSLSASGSHIDRVGIIRDESDRESASNRAIAGSSLNDSLSGSAVAGPSGFQNRCRRNARVLFILLKRR